MLKHIKQEKDNLISKLISLIENDDHDFSHEKQEALILKIKALSKEIDDVEI